MVIWKIGMFECVASREVGGRRKCVHSTIVTVVLPFPELPFMAHAGFR